MAILSMQQRIKLAYSIQAPAPIKAVLAVYAEENGRGNVLWPLRVSLSGKERSPDPFVIAEILGKKETLKRLQSAVQ